VHCALQVPGKVAVTRDGLKFMAVAADVKPESFFGVQFFNSMTELEVRAHVHTQSAACCCSRWRAFAMFVCNLLVFLGLCCLSSDVREQCLAVPA
jgi:hypothetical protein